MSLQPVGRDGRPVGTENFSVRSTRLREFMRRYGYELHLSQDERWAALRKAVEELGAGKVFALLDRLRLLVSESGRQIVEVDMEYVRWLSYARFITRKDEG